MSIYSTARAAARQWLARRLHLPETPPALRHLAGQGFAPSLIVDIGAYRGEFARECLAVWPGGEIACFEPQAARQPALAALERSARVRLFPLLVGAEERGEVPLHLAESASSVLDEHIEQGHPVDAFPMRTLDSVLAEHYGARHPEFIKADVQGYELEVLKGATDALAHAQVLLLELNLLDIHMGVPLLSDVVTWLAIRGWVAYDICGLTRRPLDGALWQADVLFVPRESPLRQDKRWV